jgi:hypothetical protein
MSFLQQITPLPITENKNAFSDAFRGRTEQKNLYLPYSTIIRLRTIAAKEQKAWQR